MNGWCSIPSGVTAELMAQTGFDMLTIDMQHGLIDYQVAVQMLQAMSASPAPKIVRIHRMSRASPRRCWMRGRPASSAR